MQSGITQLPANTSDVPGSRTQRRVPQRCCCFIEIFFYTIQRLLECLFQTYLGHIATTLITANWPTVFLDWYFCHSLELLSPNCCCCNCSLNCFPWETYGKLPQGIGWEFCAREEEKKVSLQDDLKLMRMKSYWVLYSAENELASLAVMIGVTKGKLNMLRWVLLKNILMQII